MEQKKQQEKKDEDKEDNFNSKVLRALTPVLRGHGDDSAGDLRLLGAGADAETVGGQGQKVQNQIRGQGGHRRALVAGGREWQAVRPRRG